MTCMVDACQHTPYIAGMADQNDKVFQMRVSEAFLRTLDDWRRSQPDLPSRAEAVRRLVEIGINVGRAGPRSG